MAGLVLFLNQFFFFPTLVALAVASFQVRKADLPARVAERTARTGGRGGVIDADSEELEDEPLDDDVDDASDGSGSVDEQVGTDTAGDEDADELAELEAELEAEERARRGGTGSASRGATPEE